MGGGSLWEIRRRRRKGMKQMGKGRGEKEEQGKDEKVKNRVGGGGGNRKTFSGWRNKAGSEGNDEEGGWIMRGGRWEQWRK
jgi:hypothetical protein